MMASPVPALAANRRAFVIAALALASSVSFAQADSQAPIKLIVPFTPGTGIDLIARQVGPHLPQRLGRPVIVDNKPGASGNLGTQEVVRAAADGATLLVTVNTLVMNPALYPEAALRSAEGPRAGVADELGRSSCWWRARSPASRARRS